MHYLVVCGVFVKQLLYKYIKQKQKIKKILKKNLKKEQKLLI